MTVAEPPHVVIVGGGIAGLAAAFYLKDEPVRVTVLEGSPRLGGKLSASDVAGVPMDEGAEALLARRPEGIDLITATGLAGNLVPAGTTSSAIFTRGAMRPLPRRQFMGVPADMDELAATGVVSANGVARARHEEQLPPSTADTSVTGYIGARLGREIVDRLVDPLLGGVYAGRSDELSFQATLAPLAAATKTHASLTEAVAALLPPALVPSADKRSAPAPVFVTLTTGLGALPDAVAKASNADIRTARWSARSSARRPAGGSPSVPLPTRSTCWLTRSSSLPRGARFPAFYPERSRPPPRRSARSRTRAWRLSHWLTGPRISPGRSAAATSSRPSTAGPSRRPRSPPSSGRTLPRTRRCTSSAVPSAGSARRRCCSATTRTWRRSPPPSSPTPRG